jgi:hypothetical protein
MRKSIGILVVASSVIGVLGMGCSSGDAGPSGDEYDSLAQAIGPAFGAAHICADPQPGFARCHAIARLGADGTPAATGTPSGFGPADLRSAYNLPSTGGSGVTVAIVDAYGYPNAESDLAVYRAQYGLPPCTTANGCFRKVSQSGTTSYPRNDSGWATEQALDVDMVSAVCPSCNILLVESNSATTPNLEAAVATAVRLGASVVSNSYGGGEPSNAATDQGYNFPGVAITASSGDNGYGVEFPASSPFVTAVGGTHLVKDSSARGWTETAWSGAGSGCSKYVPKPSWQHDTGCSMRTVADVSAVADPNTGVAVYETFGRRGGWQVYGGTSVASPIIGAVFALGGAQGPSYPYAHSSSLNDVKSGSNGSCGGSYLCTATTGYDGPTGLGTPNGASAF